MKRGSTQSVGRRKTSVARVYLRPGSGKFMVNGKDYQEYFGRKTLQMVVQQPLKLIQGSETFDIVANVNGGGSSGQAGAVRHALARALVVQDAENKSAMRKNGYLTRDSREVERKKYGRHKARRRPQFSKR